MFNSAPPAEQPKTGSDFIQLPPFPDSDTYVGCLVAANYIPDYETQDRTTGEKKVFDAVELYYGAIASDGKPYFVRTWPMRYSVSEKAKYATYIKAATGEFPEAKSQPSDFFGKPVLLTIKTEEKKSRKGKLYTASTIDGIAPVPKSLKANAPDGKALQAALEAAIKDIEARQNDTSAPF